MNLLAGFQADKLIAELCAVDADEQERTRELNDRIVRLGAGAVPRLLDALREADRHGMMLLLEPLGRLVSEQTLRHYRQALRSDNLKVVQGAAAALASRRSYDPNSLLDLLRDEDVARARLLEVLNAHKDRVNARALLPYAYDLDGKDQADLLAIVSGIANESLVPELLDRMTGADRDVRRAITEMLGRFPREDVARGLTRQLDDQDRGVRRAAVRSLARMPQKVDLERMCRMLLDSDIDVQNAAVEVISELGHTASGPCLAAVMRTAVTEDNDYARRAVVEVLNEIGTPDHINDLLAAMRDDDWWVRSRAADALGKIGGPAVLDAVLSIVDDPNEEVRRFVVEILNGIQDPRAFDYLVRATNDSDWWVRERAADALAKLGDARAVPALIQLLRTWPRSAARAIAALEALGDRRVVTHLMPLLGVTDKSIKIQAINASVRLAGAEDAAPLRERLSRTTGTDDSEVSHAVKDAMRTLRHRFPDSVSGTIPEAAPHTLLHEEETAAPLPPPLPSGPATQTKSVIDIDGLREGAVIDDRYEFIKRIGRGAYGTVLLVRDTVVDEKLVLKFLHKSIADDPETMKRFVQEVRLARKITHRNVIRLYDFLSVGGLNAISMEYFRSNPLTAEVADRQPVPLVRGLRIAHDVALGMGAAHQEAIVHRDLKPPNILINADDLVKIVDFGVSAVLNAETNLTKTGYVIGSPKYMSPEQILGKEVDQTLGHIQPRRHPL
jgi:HEAT repeat protein/tRNA A-37 threonylcarbamoyl transferase component Bud32